MEAEQAELELVSFPASGALASLSEAQRQRRTSVRLRVEQAELVLLEACFGALVFYAHGHRERLGVGVGVGVRAGSRGKG